MSKVLRRAVELVLVYVDDRTGHRAILPCVARLVLGEITNFKCVNPKSPSGRLRHSEVHLVAPSVPLEQWNRLDLEHNILFD
jgi:hypothetical protein